MFRFLFLSPSFRSLYATCLLAILILFPLTASATETTPSLTTLERQISEFVNSPQYRFAPDTVARARAMLAAATMAERRQDAASRDQGALETVEALNNARRVVADFKTKYAETLKLEQAASEAAGNIPDNELRAAQDTMNDLIRAFEQGQLNDSAALAKSANQQFLAVIRAKLPSILEKTDAALLAAKRSGAKRYAPVSYAQAKKWLASALAYNDGLNRTWPTQPRLGMKLATRANELAEQVKLWRKKPGSYEVLVLKAREDRIAAASALGLHLNDRDPAADIEISHILDAIQQQQAAMQQQQQKYQQQLATLEAQCRQRLAEQASALRNELSQQQGAQMNEMKEAFRAKLERETFESRRQKKLGKLFKKNEIEILANVDGSLLLRLSALHFASGRTSIDKKYFDLLSRLRSGLDLYPERKVVVEGHTDNRGEPDINQRLSLKRAETVRDFLIAAGMEGSRLKALGYGEVRPVASNDYERGRAMNRRIDIIIQAAK